MSSRNKIKASFTDISNNTNESWWKDASLRWNVFFCTGCMMCPFYIGYDQSLLSGFQSLPQWNGYFDSPSGNRLGLISAAIFLPGTCIGFAAAWMSESWGRKPCLMVGVIIMVIGAIWNALAQDTSQFIGSRVILGIGGAITKTGAPSYVQELAHPRLRAAIGGMYYGFYYVGSLLSALLCVAGLYIEGEWAWRFPCMCILLGPIAVFLILLSAPESPRYLVKKNKTSLALQVLADSHANGDVNDPLVQWEFNEIRTALEHEEVENKSSYLDLIGTSGNRRRLTVAILIALGTSWVGNGIVSYYLTPALKQLGITDSAQLLAINAGIAAWNLIIAELAGLKVDDIGRRKLFLTSTIGMIFSYSFVMGFSAGFNEFSDKALAAAAVPFLFLFYASYDIAWTPLNYSYCAEIMPYNLRAKGLAVYLSVQQIGNAFNQFVNPIAMNAISWRYYALYIAIDCAYVILIYFFLPETKKLTIEEISLVFDYGFRGGRQKAADAFESRLNAEDVIAVTKSSDDRASVKHVEA